MAEKKLLAVQWIAEPDISHPLTEVDSSSIKRIGWDEPAHRLYVELLASGLLYTYASVPYEEFERFVEAPTNGSHGVHFNKVIKPNYYCENTVIAGDWE